MESGADLSGPVTAKVILATAISETTNDHLVRVAFGISVGEKTIIMGRGPSSDASKD